VGTGKESRYAPPGQDYSAQCRMSTSMTRKHCSPRGPRCPGGRRKVAVPPPAPARRSGWCVDSCSRSGVSAGSSNSWATGLNASGPVLLSGRCAASAALRRGLACSSSCAPAPPARSAPPVGSGRCSHSAACASKRKALGASDGGRRAPPPVEWKRRAVSARPRAAARMVRAVIVLVMERRRGWLLQFT